MKASEVLKRYAKGERNFQCVNLRGQSFKGQNLSGADFSEADIRGTNFTNCNLETCQFCGIKAGQLKTYKFILIIGACLISVLPASFYYWTGEVAAKMFSFPNLENIITGIPYFIIVIVCLITTLRKGIMAGLAVGVGCGATVGLFMMIGLKMIAKAGTISSTGFVIGLLITIWAIEGSIISAVGGSTITVITAIFAIAISSIFAIIGANSFVLPEDFTKVVTLVVAISVFFTGSGIYIGWCGFLENGRYDWLRPIGLAFATLGSTSFCNSKLIEANFTGATLENTDFRNAILTRTCWRNIKDLENVRSGNTYLNNLQVRQWLIGKGTDNNFDGQRLRGINLQGADLTDASFIASDLSEANLKDADLSRAKLVQTQLDRADLSRATLTGAYIKDWGITSDTIFNSVRCKYVFMHLPTKENPNPQRKPDNWEEEFEDGDFGDFIKPIVDTLDLYHNQGVDPRAIAISWKELAENNPDANLQFASMEVKGEDNLLLRLKTSSNTDLSRLNAEYFDTYNQIKALAEAESKKLIAEKDNRIQQLETMVNTALKRPGFYAENYNHQGDNEMAGDKYEQKGNFGIGHMSGGEIKEGAKVAGVINEAQKQNLADAAQEIQQLLERLSKTYPTTTSREKNIVVGEAVDRIENNPTLKAKVINALKAGGTEAFKEAINHPLVNIFVASIEGWQDAE